MAALINSLLTFFFTALEQDDDGMRTEDQIVNRCVYVHARIIGAEVILIIVHYHLVCRLFHRRRVSWPKTKPL